MQRQPIGQHGYTILSNIPLLYDFWTSRSIHWSAISRDRAQRKLLLSQPQYLQRIIERFHMTNSNPFSTPADPNARLDSSMSPSTPDAMHAAVCTRPDIGFAVGQAARFCQNPGKAHWSAVKRILSYLAGIKTHGLLFSRTGRTTLVGYTDSDYAGDKDTRRSTSDFIFLHLGVAISWGSTGQSCTDLSTTEAEYIAASKATKEAIWPYGSNASSHKSVIFSLAPSVFFATIRARSV